MVTAPDIVSASTARASIAPAIAARRPCGTRSSSGPTTGASRANGASVTARYSATRPRASSVGTEKNTVEASATVISMSPAEFTAWSSISLPRPDSPAPCACVARRTPRAAPVNGRCSARPTARPARRTRLRPSPPRVEARETRDDFPAVLDTFDTFDARAAAIRS